MTATTESQINALIAQMAQLDRDCMAAMDRADHARFTNKDAAGEAADEAEWKRLNKKWERACMKLIETPASGPRDLVAKLKFLESETGNSVFANDLITSCVKDAERLARMTA